MICLALFFSRVLREEEKKKKKKHWGEKGADVGESEEI
jgi:hypothetical protein